MSVVLLLNWIVIADFYVYIYYFLLGFPTTDICEFSEEALSKNDMELAVRGLLNKLRISADKQSEILQKLPSLYGCKFSPSFINIQRL